MKKKSIIFFLLCFVVLCVTGIMLFTRRHETVEFSGINGETITVHTSIIPLFRKEQQEEVDVTLGDIIEQNGVKEIVIGIAEDGRYITTIYEEENKDMKYEEDIP